MSLSFQPMDRVGVRAILKWSYPPPYDMYSLDRAGPEETAACFLDSENGYYSITSQRGELVAYCCFGPDGRVPGGDYSAPALDVGIGTRPDLTGQGGGHALTRAVLAFGRERYAPAAFRVTVAHFNKRAQRVVQKAGFEPVHTFERCPDGKGFVLLVRQERGKLVNTVC